MRCSPRRDPERAAALALALAGLVCAGSPGCSGSGDAARRPNIVLIVADDQDYEHLGFLGHELAHTPTLDRLAEAGTVFTTAHVPTSRCRPSLASLATGRWPHQHGIFFNEGEGTLDPERSLPLLLREAGYATFLGGKFWEGDHEAMGFQAATEGDDSARAGQEELFAFIDEHAGERPLLIWWAPSLPHFPHDPPERFVDALDLRDVHAPPWFERAEWAGIDAVDYRFSELMLLATVAWLDDCLRLLCDQLRSAGIYDDTLFCYLIDNGSANGLVSKGSPFEKGLRTPIVLSWPAHVPAGMQRAELVSSLDVFPTLLDYAGVDVPPGIAGHSLRPLIEGRAEAARDVLHGALYPRSARPDDPRPERNVYALYARTPEWKYVLYLQRLTDETNDLYRIKHDFAPPLVRRRGDEDLFHLANDPYELDDLSERPEHRRTLEELRAGTRTWWRSTGGGPLRLP